MFSCNRERSNTIECNAIPCINLSEYWTILEGADKQTFGLNLCNLSEISRRLVYEIARFLGVFGKNTASDISKFTNIFGEF